MRYVYNTEVLTREDSTSFYILGLFFSDGNVYKNECSIKSIDISLLNDIKRLICDKPLYKVKTTNCYRLNLNNAKIKEWLIKWGCVPNKTKIAKYPNIPKEYISHFLRGLIDGDGSIGIYDSAMLRFDSASLDLITGVSNAFIDAGINNSIKLTPFIKTKIQGRETQSTTQMYRISLSSLNCYKALKFIYNGADLCLDRKKVISDQIIKSYENKNDEQFLLNVTRIPIIRWDYDKILESAIRNKGVFAYVGKEFGVSGWTISCQLRKIGKYDYIRKLFPQDNYANFSRNIKN